eukprot:CAMPEP_0194032680 /NCGR_PEP_ID=MMETSP0009_2-20130614/5568_1 /TAXON_ID=210454 /ORGANISM="Grammatophora oceanica, Strain CCMP 410" /LENGTH=256 /DNA_ID=CAMNT_0038673193 /DNA_START=58 /DNA_END=828 /DNA_ORIENTATION=+
MSMLLSSSRHVLLRRSAPVARRSFVTTTAQTAGRSTAGTSASKAVFAIAAMGGIAALTTTTTKTTFSEKLPTSGDVLMMQPVKEKSTGILFPKLCNGMTLVGTGVRVKWGLIKVYAVGTYMDPIAMSAMKKASDGDINKALLNPMYPRTIRIVMARSLSINKYTAAIVEALEPRMKGIDMEKLEEFKKLNPPVDLVEGAEIEMTIRGDVMMYKNATGGVGRIQSQTFCEAMCDVYYGEGAVSPGHKDGCIEGVKKL